MKKKHWIAIAIAIIAVVCGIVIFTLVKNSDKVEPLPLVVEEPEPAPVDPVEYNTQRFDELISDIVVTIAYTSGFSQESYPTGERFAYGFNNTVVGKRLVREGETTTENDAYETTVEHLQKYVRPFLRYVTREMYDGELIAVAHFMYNVGGEAFTGYSADGKQIKKPSRLLVAINNNESSQNCARYFTGFRSAGGMENDGLLKLRWLQAALFTDAITSEDLLTANVIGIFGMSVPCLFGNSQPDKDGYYTPKITAENISALFKQKGLGLTTEELLIF